MQTRIQGSLLATGKGLLWIDIEEATNENSNDDSVE